MISIHVQGKNQIQKVNSGGEKYSKNREILRITTKLNAQDLSRNADLMHESRKRLVIHSCKQNLCMKTYYFYNGNVMKHRDAEF